STAGRRTAGHCCRWPRGPGRWPAPSAPTPGPPSRAAPGSSWCASSRRLCGCWTRPPEGVPPVVRVGGMPSSARSEPLRDSLGLGLAVGLYGAAFGAAAVSAGLSPWQASAMSLLMFTGASQFAVVGVLGAGGSALAAVGSALLLGTRNTVYGVRLVPLLAPRGALRRAATAHWVIDETTALAVSAPDRGLARLAFRAGGGTIFTLWNVTTLVGALGAGALGGTAQAGLDAVVPAAFLALLWPRLRRGFPEA